MFGLVFRGVRVTMEPSGKELYPWICTCQSERTDYALSVDVLAPHKFCTPLVRCGSQIKGVICAIALTWTARLISLTAKQESLSELNDIPECPVCLLYSGKTWDGVEAACMCVQFCCSLAR